MQDMPPVTITRLGPDDLAQMRALNALFARVFEAPQDYAEAPPGDAYLARQLAREQVIVLTACAGDRVIGGLVAYDLPKLEQARSEIYLYDLAVDPGFWRQGVATALIQRLCRIAEQIGAWVVFVQADHGDDPAIALYSKLGQREDVLHFDILP